jgi:hypothetical protein
MSEIALLGQFALRSSRPHWVEKRTFKPIRCDDGSQLCSRVNLT